MTQFAAVSGQVAPAGRAELCPPPRLLLANRRRSSSAAPGAAARRSSAGYSGRHPDHEVIPVEARFHCSPRRAAGRAGRLGDALRSSAPAGGRAVVSQPWPSPSSRPSSSGPRSTAALERFLGTGQPRTRSAAGRDLAEEPVRRLCAQQGQARLGRDVAGQRDLGSAGAREDVPRAENGVA